jgi:hypothetical protein
MRNVRVVVPRASTSSIVTSASFTSTHLSFHFRRLAVTAAPVWPPLGRLDLPRGATGRTPAAARTRLRRNQGRF